MLASNLWVDADLVNGAMVLCRQSVTNQVDLHAAGAHGKAGLGHGHGLAHSTRYAPPTMVWDRERDSLVPRPHPLARRRVW